MSIDPITGSAAANSAAATSSTQTDPQYGEPAWKKEFQQTLQDILDAGGFFAYAKKLDESKIEEMRKKILAGMGLTEDKLSKMPAKQRETIEKMVSNEIRMRLAAESALKNGKDGSGNTDPQGTHEAYLGSQIQAGGSRFGTATAMMAVLQQVQQHDATLQHNSSSSSSTR